MIRITSISISNVDRERKLEIQGRAKNIIEIIKKYNIENWYSIDYKLDRCTRLYRDLFDDNMNEHEKSIFYLYVLFPDDIKFMNLIEQYEKNATKIAKVYNLNKDIVKLRYKLYKSVNDVKTLNLKNNSQN